MATGAENAVKCLKAAHAEPVGFAFGTNASSGELVAEKGKSGDQLQAVVKRMNGIKQSCAGMARYDGSTLTLICDHPISNLPKLVETWGKANKFNAKVVVTTTKAEHEAEDRESEDDEEDGNVLFAFETVKRRLLQAKTKPMFFAFGLSTHKTPDLLGLHPVKSADKLMLAIRKENGAIKRAWGTATVNGSMVTFACEEEPFSSMKRSLRRLFKAWKLALRVTIIGPQGEFTEPGDEDEEEGAEIETHDTSETLGDADLRRLEAELSALLPALKAIFATLPDQAAAIRSEYAGCQAAIKAGNASEAQALLERLRTHGAGTSGGGDRLRQLKTRLEAMLPGLKELAKDTTLTQRIRGHWQAAEAALRAGDAGTASSEIDALAAIAPKDKPGNWRDAYAAWQDAKDTIDRQLNALSGHLRRTGDKELIEIADKGLMRMTNDCFVPVRAAFLDFGRAKPADRPTIAREAIKRAARLRAQIESDERIAACEENPFVEVTIRKTLIGSLQGVVAVLEQSAN